MTRPLTLRIALVDGEHARFVEPDTSNVLRTVGGMDAASAHLRSQDLTSDRPGRAFESGSTARHAIAPRHDQHTIEKQRFARMVGEELTAAVKRDDFDELLLIAPPRVLSDVLDALDAAAADRLVGTLEKDLVKTPDHELWPHVSEWVSRSRRPTG